MGVFREILQKDKMQRSKNNYVYYFPQERVVTFVLFAQLRCLTIFVCWNLARSLNFPACHLTALLRIANANPDPDPGTIESGSNPDPQHCILVLILVPATLMQLLWFFSNYTQLTSLPADSVGPGPGHPAAPVLAVAS